MKYKRRWIDRDLYITKDNNFFTLKKSENSETTEELKKKGITLEMLKFLFPGKTIKDKIIVSHECVPIGKDKITTFTNKEITFQELIDGKYDKCKECKQKLSRIKVYDGRTHNFAELIYGYDY